MLELTLPTGVTMLFRRDPRDNLYYLHYENQQAETVLQDAGRVSFAAIVAVVLVLSLAFRNIWTAFQLLIPVGIGLVVTAAITTLLLGPTPSFAVQDRVIDSTITR